MGEEIKVALHRSVRDIGAADWDACAAPEASDGGRALDPFTTYRFLEALEESGSVGAQSGWDPYYVTARIGDEITGCAPMYLKSHSQGEYIFDHSWADAYERSGGRYYPKLQVAVPFTPVTGRRLLVRGQAPQETATALLTAMTRVAGNNRLSGVHLTFCTGSEAALGAQLGYMPRLSQQYHWVNAGYTGFEDFLAQLSSRKRKTLRRERLQAQSFGGEIVALSGDELRPEHWQAMWAFYQDTGSRKWGRPYLTHAFFELATERLSGDVVMMLARRGGAYVAGALNFIGRDALYGRYWGCREHHPCLHFEMCYYRAIDYAIAHGLARVEAGAQGEHKLARGYLPAATHSLHWLTDERFAEAVSDYLEAERHAVEEDMEVLTGFGPFRRSAHEEKD